MTIRTESTNRTDRTNRRRRNSTNGDEWGEHGRVWMVGELGNFWQLGKLGLVWRKCERNEKVCWDVEGGVKQISPLFQLVSFFLIGKCFPIGQQMLPDRETVFWLKQPKS